MIGDSLTLDNLKAIHEAMSKIREVDRSQYFKNYWYEIESRISELSKIDKIRANEGN